MVNILDTEFVTPVQLLPSAEYAIVYPDTPLYAPTATHNDPLHAIPLAVLVIIPVELLEPVQFTPSGEYAIELLPAPTATQTEPFHATPRPLVVNILLSELVTPVQFIPLQFIPLYE